jgi:hypothetical protein
MRFRVIRAAQLLINALIGQMGPSVDLSGYPTNQALGRVSWNRPWPSKTGSHDQGSLQLRVFCFGLLQDGDVRVGVLPEREEILIG